MRQVLVLEIRPAPDGWVGTILVWMGDRVKALEVGSLASEVALGLVEISWGF